MRASDIYQLSLIFLGVVATALFGVFFYRELFPEYKIYQNVYVDLEKFRSSYTGETPPPFEKGIKQIVLPDLNNGPPTIDRCTSCHVALKFSHFSPTKIARDVNGKILVDEHGNPLLVRNEDYIWDKLDQKIAELKDEAVNRELEEEGKSAQVGQRLKEAERLLELKTATVGEQTYDMTRVLRAHPLIGKETRPFEYHPMEEYGCTSCHNGNGRGLTTEKAHGPVFDGQYEPSFEGFVPQFLEKDPENDPRFSQIFNHKPDHGLLFQTTPLFVGGLMEAKCVQCHLPSSHALRSIASDVDMVKADHEKRVSTIREGLWNEREALEDLLKLKKGLQSLGYAKMLEGLQERTRDYTLPPEELEKVVGQVDYVVKRSGEQDKPFLSEDEKQKHLLKAIDSDIDRIAGSFTLAEKIVESLKNGKGKAEDTFLQFFQRLPEEDHGKGSFFVKGKALIKEQEKLKRLSQPENLAEGSFQTQGSVDKGISEIDLMTGSFQRGEQLFISQACYACHQINGISRGGVGPELTRIGLSYPWFIKESIVWPQADLPTSTMPNFHLDHDEVEDLMTFLLAQRGDRQAVSEFKYKAIIKEWEAGQKSSEEQPLDPNQVYDLRTAMNVFAMEGCAACHRLKGFDSNVGYRVEKENPSLKALLEEKEWFQKLFPEEIIGSQIVTALEKHGKEVDRRLVDGVRDNAILEEIDSLYPDTVISFYSNFKYPMRAKNHHYHELAEKDPEKKDEILHEGDQWKQRVRRVLMMYVQEYGLGRLVAPRLNWSGIFRSDKWVMEHFWNPSSHTPKSIMPVMPFDDTKFYALTHMLDVLSKQNRDELQLYWNTKGFDPIKASQIYCAQCHGEHLRGDGPVSQWIYPIPKDLRNADFLRNLTKEKVVESIAHGVKGTPMPPWGEVAEKKRAEGEKPVLSEAQIELLADWLFSELSRGEVIRMEEDVLKWQYMPEDVIKELRLEGDLPKIQKKAPNQRKVLEDRPSSSSLIPVTPLGVVLKVPKRKESVQLQEFFDVEEGPHGEGPQYYIRREFYTDENLREGEQLFITNCAVCHGNEGTGAGVRAVTMKEAKPRMLTNLDWLVTRDDLRLLRSIKFGVPGTAMTPWGDLTSSLQRLQLVMFIRHLNEEHQLRRRFTSAIYDVFEEAEMAITKGRGEGYAVLKNLRIRLTEAVSRRKELQAHVVEGQDISKDAIETYEKELTLANEIKKHEAFDQVFQSLFEELRRERELYEKLGEKLISLKIENLLDSYFRILELNEGRYGFAEGKLVRKEKSEQLEEMEALFNSMIENVEKKISLLEEERQVLLGKIPSQERTEGLSFVSGRLGDLNKLKAQLLSGQGEARRSREKQAQIFTLFKSVTK